MFQSLLKRLIGQSRKALTGSQGAAARSIVRRDVSPADDSRRGSRTPNYDNAAVRAKNEKLHQVYRRDPQPAPQGGSRQLVVAPKTPRPSMPAAAQTPAPSGMDDPNRRAQLRYEPERRRVLETPETKRAVPDREKRRENYPGVGVLKKDPDRGMKGTPRVLTDEEYQALTPTERAVVDFNSALAQAVDADRKEGLKKGEGSEGYKTDVGDLFGEKETRYAPRTVALLKELDIDVGEQTLDDFLDLRAGIQDHELEKFGGAIGYEAREGGRFGGKELDLPVEKDVIPTEHTEPYSFEMEATNVMKSRLAQEIAEGLDFRRDIMLRAEDYGALLGDGEKLIRDVQATPLALTVEEQGAFDYLLSDLFTPTNQEAVQIDPTVKPTYGSFSEAAIHGSLRDLNLDVELFDTYLTQALDEALYMPATPENQQVRSRAQTLRELRGG